MALFVTTTTTEMQEQHLPYMEYNTMRASGWPRTPFREHSNDYSIRFVRSFFSDHDYGLRREHHRYTQEVPTSMKLGFEPRYCLSSGRSFKRLVEHAVWEPILRLKAYHRSYLLLLKPPEIMSR